MLARLRSLYRTLGPRYPRAVLLGVTPAAYLTGLLAVAGTALYIDMSASEFVRLLVAASLLIWTVEVGFEVRLILRRLEPITAWIRGERSRRETTEAWEAAAGLPIEFLREPLRYAAVAAGIAVWDLYASWELDLPASSAAILFPGSLLVYLYWVVVRFLAIELSLRPVLEDIASSVADGTELKLVRVPLRWRLLASLPAVNLITGIAVGGFAADETSDLGNFGLALLGSAAAAVLVSSWLVGFLSASIATPIAELRDANRQVARGDLSVRVPVASTDETGELARSFNEMVAGLGERERLREAFGAFVDPELVERVLRDGTDLAGEEVEVSVLFMDIREFTSYAERASARDVVARLNDLYEQVVPVITERGGHANKFVGDGLLAVFGTPHRLRDHADCAVSAGLEIARVVRERYDGELHVGVGVNSGSVMSGTVGGGGRLDFTVIGDVVNTAARIEAATRDTGDEMLIGETTLGLLSDDRERFEERPTLPLKGKAEQVRLYAPLKEGEPQ
jgi:class 3 adenylate cyclase